jgi:hypothetical protein
MPQSRSPPTAPPARRHVLSSSGASGTAGVGATRLTTSWQSRAWRADRCRCASGVAHPQLDRGGGAQGRVVDPVEAARVGDRPAHDLRFTARVPPVQVDPHPPAGEPAPTACPPPATTGTAATAGPSSAPPAPRVEHPVGPSPAAACTCRTAANVPAPNTPSSSSPPGTESRSVYRSRCNARTSSPGEFNAKIFALGICTSLPALYRRGVLPVVSCVLICGDVYG